MDYSKLLQKLLTAGEENSSKAIQALKTGETKLPSFLREAEEAVVEDPRLVKTAAAKVLPDIETTAKTLGDDLQIPMQRVAGEADEELAKKYASIPKGPSESIGAAPTLANTADELTGSLDDLLTQKASNTGRNAAIAGGLLGAGTIGYMATKDEEPPVDTSVPAHILQNADREQPKPYNPTTVAANKAMNSAAKKALEPITQTTETSQQVSAPPADDFAFRLADAQRQDKERNELFGLLRASQQAGAALAGAKADTSYADSELAKENKSVEDLSAAEKLKKANLDLQDQNVLRDPNSSISQQARDIATKVGLKVAPNISAEQLKNAGLPIGNLLTQKLAIDARHEDNKFKYAMLGEQKKQAADAKKEAAATKESIAFDKAVDYGAKARGALGEAKSVFDRSERLNAMFSTLPVDKKGNMDFSKVDPLQKAEMVKAIDTIISGKSTIGGSAELTKASSSFKDELAHLKQYVLGDGLVPLNQQQTVKKLYDTIQREREITGSQLAKAAATTAQAYKNLNPEDKTRVIAEKYGVSPEEQELLTTHRLMPGMLLDLKQRGIDPKDAVQMLRSGKSLKEVVGDKQPLTTIDKGAKPVVDSKIQAYATQHSLPYEQAEAILRSRGYNGSK